jgi:primosomal protein N' (replication factor Y)
MIAAVAVSAATYFLDKPYDYIVPEALEGSVCPGVRVLAPFSRGNRLTEGIVLATRLDEDTDARLKCIASVTDLEPVLSGGMLKLALWMHERFFCTVFEAVRAMLPAGLFIPKGALAARVSDKTVSFAGLNIPSDEALAQSLARRRSSPMQSAVLEFLAIYGGATLVDIRQLVGAATPTVKRLESEGLLTIEQAEVLRRPEYRVGAKAEPPELNEAQKTAYDGVLALTLERKPACALLYGVTGSGKTAVYIHLIADVLKAGRSALLLVPEIALTPQMLETFSSYFGNEIAVMHSRLSIGERYDEWKRVRRGEARLVIGTRSAVFAPVVDLGLIIIDEEQEETYKSESAPRYHARDVAKFRCARAGAVLLLGSATPNIETAYNAKLGKYSSFSLPGRFNEMELPQVQIVDMKKQLREGNGGEISSVLIDELRLNIERGEQSILFLNRRGMNKLISCGECGYTYRCPRCSVNLAYHSYNERLMCHYCGFSRRVEGSCPDCGGELKHIGAGTQKIEEELSRIFPEAPILRMDTDSVTSAGGHDALFERFRKEKIPIMVGTQMVTKGLDFPNVTLVGVVSADQSLYAGDYRANERTFSLITQVVGRSGRGQNPGRAVIQTFTPGNQVILQAARQDYSGFFNSELELRRLQWCPPFAELYSVTGTGTDEAAVLRALTKVRALLARELREDSGVRILGPAPLPVARVNNRFRYRVTLAAGDRKEIRELLSAVIIYCGKNKEFRGVSLFGDVNPV